MDIDWNDIKDDQQATSAQRRALYRWLFADHDRMVELIQNMNVQDAATILKILSKTANSMIPTTEVAK